MKEKIIFGTGGFRGIIGESFNKTNVQLITQALCDLYHEKGFQTPIVIGYDYRFLSDKAAEWVCEVVTANEIMTIISKEPVPTPAVMYKTKSMDNDLGIMITASHNPYYFNGIKVFQKKGMDADVHLTGLIEKKIQMVKNIKILDYSQALKSIYLKRLSFTKEYVHFIKKYLSPQIYNSDIRILYDNLHSVGIRTISLLVKELGFKNFTTISKKHDPFFGHKMPNPTKENMEKDRKYLEKGQYDCIFGIDSDGDRLGILDENGRYVDNNEILASLYYYLVKYRHMKGDIVKNCATSNLVDKVAHKFGFQCHEVDVGFKNISEKMMEVDALIGGESSGGLTIRDYLYGKDSTLSSILFFEMIIVMNKSVSQIIAEVRDFANFHHATIERQVSYKNEDRVLSYLKKKTISFPTPFLKRELLGKNIKYIFSNDCWVLLRCSGTEPVLRVFIEMENEQQAEEYLKVIEKYIEKIDS